MLTYYGLGKVVEQRLIGKTAECTVKPVGFQVSLVGYLPVKTQINCQFMASIPLSLAKSVGFQVSLVRNLSVKPQINCQTCEIPSLIDRKLTSQTPN